MIKIANEKAQHVLDKMFLQLSAEEAKKMSFSLSYSSSSESFKVTLCYPVFDSNLIECYKRAEKDLKHEGYDVKIHLKASRK